MLLNIVTFFQCLVKCVYQVNLYALTLFCTNARVYVHVANTVYMYMQT